MKRNLILLTVAVLFTGCADYNYAPRPANWNGKRFGYMPLKVNSRLASVAKEIFVDPYPASDTCYTGLYHPVYFP